MRRAILRHGPAGSNQGLSHDLTTVESASLFQWVVTTKNIIFDSFQIESLN
jgi:hypothetical protein